MSKDKIHVGVVFGGDSGEHNVSIQSARNVINALSIGINSNRFEVVSIYIDQKGRWWDSQIAKKALKEGIALEDERLHSENVLLTGFTKLPKEAEKIDI